MSATAPQPFECVVPILRVRSLETSLAYYVGVLGFTVAWRQEGVAQVSRGAGAVMLCEGGQGQPGTWVWFGVDDAERLCEELRGRGATILQPPRNYPWACEIHVQDPDGHVLRCGSEPHADRPFDRWGS